MSTVSGGQGNIVTNGLVLNLDAANPRSYAPPFNGTVWNDLSGNGNNGTLVSDVAYTGSNGGALVFDGSNDYVNMNNYSFSGYEGTFDIWFKTSNTSSYLFILNKGILTASPTTNNGITIISPSYETGSIIVYANNSTGSTKSVLQTTSTINFRNNQWYNICATIQYTGTNTILSTYINGTSPTIYSRSGDYFDFFNLTPSYYLSTRTTNGGLSQIDISTHKIYNRALNPSEVLQNFNATRARFGI